MELLDTDLHRVIQSTQKLTFDHVKYFTYQLLCGVKYMHDNRIIHRDLKPCNLLVTRDCQLRITDFGLARQMVVSLRDNDVDSDSEPGSGVGVGVGVGPGSGSRSGSAMTEHVVTRYGNES